MEFLNGAKNGINLNKSNSKSQEPIYKTTRNINNSRELSPSIMTLTTFRSPQPEPQIGTLIQEAKKVLQEKMKKKEVTEINGLNGLLMQTTATFAKQQSMGVKRKENNSFFIFNTNSSLNNENELREQEFVKQEFNKIFKERSPIAKKSYLEEISFDMSLNVNLQQETAIDTSQNLSFLAQSHLNKHIENIDEDIEGLADIFHDKLLKEKVLKGLKLLISSEKEKLQVFLFLISCKYHEFLENFGQKKDCSCIF